MFAYLYLAFLSLHSLKYLRMFEGSYIKNGCNLQQAFRSKAFLNVNVYFLFKIFCNDVQKRFWCKCVCDEYFHTTKLIIICLIVIICA